MNTQLLSSTPRFDTRRLAAGIIRDNEVHLTPLAASVQMTPGFTMLDKVVDKHEEDAKKECQDSEAKAVTVGCEFTKH